MTARGRRRRRSGITTAVLPRRSARPTARSEVGRDPTWRSWSTTSARSRPHQRQLQRIDHVNGHRVEPIALPVSPVLHDRLAVKRAPELFSELALEVRAEPLDILSDARLRQIEQAGEVLLRDTAEARRVAAIPQILLEE